jgi:hypothetical protein
MAAKEAELERQMDSIANRIHKSAQEQAWLDAEMAVAIANEMGDGGIPSGGGSHNAGFEAGNLISDGKFYTSGTMSVDQIQAFLNAKGVNCRSNCIKDYHVVSDQGEASSGCSGYPSGNNISAAQAISIAAKACNISEKVLIVMLQKEQGLISATSPTDNAYRFALGYGCPDTAGCDARHGGLFNQLYTAAWQFNYYRSHANAYRYKPFQNNEILYHPNAGCGTKNVYIQNYATHGLYTYTPYTPNDAAVNAGLGGLGDSCSSYGNRNFYFLYLSWFGNPK